MRPGLPGREGRTTRPRPVLRAGAKFFLGGMTPTSDKPSTVAGCASAHGALVADPLPFTPIVRTMRAVVISDFGGPEVLRVASRPDPVPGTGEIVVRLGQHVHETVAVAAPTGMDALRAGAIPEVYMTAYDTVCFTKPD